MQNQQVVPEYGTPPKFLCRAEGPDTSKASAEAVDSAGLERMVFNTIRSFGPLGCTSDDVRAQHPNRPYSSITARYKALLDKGYIVDTGGRRAGRSGRMMRVMVANVA